MSSTKQPGLTLADLAGVREQVPFGESFIEVRGISTANALAILQRFPHLAKLTNGFKISDLLVVAPEAVAAIIAAGIGKPNDEQEEEAASVIPIEAQFDLIEAIGRSTFKSGFGPFVQRVIALARDLKSDPSIRVPSMNSPVMSKNSSPAATTLQPSSTTPPDKSPPTSSSPASDAAVSDTPSSPTVSSPPTPETAKT